jgi:hypothetical protein
VHQDINLFASELDAVGQAVTLQLKPGRMAYLLCVEGAVTVSTAEATASTEVTAAGPASDANPLAGGKGRSPVTARRHDAVELQGQGASGTAAAVAVTVTAVAVEAAEGGKAVSHFIVFEMAQDPRGGRKDLTQRTGK